MTTASDAMPEAIAASAGRPAATSRDPAVLLVGPPRALGEPLDLDRAAGRRRDRRLLIGLRLHQHGSAQFAARACAALPSPPATTDASTQSGRTPDRRSRYEFVCTACDHGDGRDMFLVAVFYCLGALAQRAPGPQHPVLEIAARARPDHRARQGRRAGRHPAASDLRRRRRQWTDHVPLERGGRAAAGKNAARAVHAVPVVRYC